MRPVPGILGLYATELGQLVSVRSGEPIALKQRADRDGYLVVTVRSGLAKRNRGARPVHRLVAAAFHGMPTSDTPDVRHLDGVKTNNKPDNLQWGTPLQNAHDAMRHGTLGPGMLARHRRLTTDDVLAIVIRAEAGEATSSLGAAFSVNQRCVQHILAGKRWSCLTGIGEGKVR